MTTRFCVGSGLLAVVLAVFTGASASTADAPRPLEQGKPQQRELGAGESHDYSVKLKRGWFLLGELDQRGIDVVIRVFDPSGDQVAEFDSPNGPQGPEPFSLFADAAGSYRIEVRPFDGEQPTGRYAIELFRVEPGARSIEGRIDQTFARWDRPDTPGAAIAVARGGKVIFRRGYGQATLEYDVPITTRTVFHVASVSKQFTAFAVALLAERGKLSLDDDVRSWIPEIPDFGETITLRHLIHHTSGLRDQWNLLALGGWRLDDVITTEHIMSAVARQRDLNFPPGEEHVYCNTGYTLLAQVVERVTGQTFREWTRTTLFEPLGMNDTHFHDDHEHIVPNRAYSYAPDGNGFRKSVLSYANAGATSLFTTAEDLLRWSRNLDSGEIGGASVVSLVHQRGSLNDGTELDYAFGLAIGEFRGLPTVSHSGGDAGFRSHLVRFPEQDLAVVVLSNLASFNPQRAALQVAGFYLEDEIERAAAAANAAAQPESPGDEAQPVEVDPQVLESLAGRYRLPDGGPTVTLDVRSGRLIGNVPGQPAVELVPRSETEFFVQEIGARVSFERDEAGEVTGLILDQNGRQRIAPRLEPREPVEVSLAGLSGRYFSPELDTFYTIVVEDERVLARHARHGDILLTAQGGNRFSSSAWYLGDVEFVLDEQGNVVAMLVSSGRVRGLRFERR